MILRFAPLVALAILAGCQTPTATVVEAEAPAFTNADAMNTYQTLGLVKGALRPLPSVASSTITDPEAVFADAIAYAGETESYALLIWHDGALVLEHYFPGYGAEVRAEPASMHKSVLGLVTAKALEEGHIASPDTPIGTYIPEWSADPRGDITVRQLLTMSSGLAPLSYVGGDDAPARKFMAGGLNARETLLNLKTEEADAPHFHYINTVSQLLLMVVENATDTPYAQYLSEKIWRPIGADDAYVYNFEEGGFPRGYASLLARPLDWLRLGLLVKDDGRFAGSQIIDAKLVRKLKSGSQYNADYGWQIWRGESWTEQRFYNEEGAGFSVTHSAPFAVDDLVYFDGFGGQRVYTSQSEDLVIVRLGNTSTVWDDARLPNSVIAALESLRED